jgi:hypothetical protein
LTFGKTFQQAMLQGEFLQKRCDATWRGVQPQITRSLLVAPVAELGCSVHGRRWLGSFRSPVTADQGCVFKPASSKLRLLDSAPLSVQRFGPYVIYADVDLEHIEDLFCSTAEQGARANAGICHAACDRMSFEMKPQKANRDAARGAPAPGVAHLGRWAKLEHPRPCGRFLISASGSL